MAAKPKIIEDHKLIMNVVTYERVSDLGQTEDQGGRRLEDGSPDAQRRKNEEYVTHLSKKTGIACRIVDQICDEGFSGTNTKRPGYQRLWSLVASGNVQAVVASELSRLSRSVSDFLAFIAHCEKHNVQVHIIGLDLDTSSPFGRVLVVILVALAQFESEMTRKRVKENTLLRLLKDGRINGAREILGLVADPNRKGHFIRDEAGLISAEKILRLFVKLSSRKKVLLMANELGLAGPQGKEVTMKVIDAVLDNARWRYRGLWHVNLENEEKSQSELASGKRFQPVSLPHGPLLDIKLLDEVVHKRVDTAARRKRSGKEDYTYLLSHSLYYEDGSKFSGQPGKGRKYRYYHNRTHDVRIRCDHLDPLVADRVKACFQESGRFSQLVKEAILRRQEALPKLEAELARVRKELRDLQRAEENMADHLMDPARQTDPAFMPWLQEQVGQLKRRRDRLAGELQALEQQRRRDQKGRL